LGKTSYFGISIELTEERVETRLESRVGIVGPLPPLEDPVELPLLIDMDRREGAIEETVEAFLLLDMGGTGGGAIGAECMTG
jgi:hypothetical protein